MGHVLHCHQGDVTPTAQAFSQLTPNDEVETVEQHLPHFGHQGSENVILPRFVFDVFFNLKSLSANKLSGVSIYPFYIFDQDWTFWTLSVLKIVVLLLA